MAKAKSPSRSGALDTRWTYVILGRSSDHSRYEEAWNYGFPQELEHFVKCVKEDLQPEVTGHDGRAVMEALYAAYASAGEGRRIDLPFTTDAKTPFELWGGV